MEQNNLASQVPPVQSNPPVSPAPAAPVVPSTPPSEGGNRMVLWLIIGLVVIVLVTGGIYLFLSRQQPAEVTPAKTGVSRVPPPTTVENLENDLNAIDIADPEQDFTAVDQDLKQL